MFSQLTDTQPSGTENWNFCFSQIAPSAKKLWGVEESKEEGPKGILNMNGGDIQCGSVWRDSTWSTSGK